MPGARPSFFDEQAEGAGRRGPLGVRGCVGRRGGCRIRGRAGIRPRIRGVACHCPRERVLGLVVGVTGVSRCGLVNYRKGWGVNSTGWVAVGRDVWGEGGTPISIFPHRGGRGKTGHPHLNPLPGWERRKREKMGSRLHGSKGGPPPTARFFVAEPPQNDILGWASLGWQEGEGDHKGSPLPGVRGLEPRGPLTSILSQDGRGGRGRRWAPAFAGARGDGYWATQPPSMTSSEPVT